MDGFNSGYLNQVGILPRPSFARPGRMLSIPVAFAALGNANVKVSPTSPPEDLRGWGSTRRAAYGPRYACARRHTCSPHVGAPGPEGHGGHTAAWPAHTIRMTVWSVRESSEVTSEDWSVIDGIEFLGSRRDLPVPSSVSISDIGGTGSLVFDLIPESFQMAVRERVHPFCDHSEDVQNLFHDTFINDF